MEQILRDAAIVKLRLLVGQDLRLLATQYGLTVFKESGGFNKGWAGLVLERYLGLLQNSSQTPDFGDWELKVIPLKTQKANSLVPKETMAITMINPLQVAETPFRRSHLYEKLRRLVICARTFVDKQETSSILYQVEAFDFDDLSDVQMITQIENDYEAVRAMLNNAASVTEGFERLTGKMGVYVQPRTKGPGKGSTSRAFYLRTSALKILLKI